MAISTTQCRIKLIKTLQTGLLFPVSINILINEQQVRHRRTKHWNPGFKRLRAEKFIKVDLPNFNEKQDEMSTEEIRSKMKERGVLPIRPWMERPFFISATGGVFEAYVPPEGDGKMSAISKTGAKQKLEFLEKKSKSMMAVRKIRSFDEDFEPPEFALHAQDIYIKVHEYMAQKDKDKLPEVITERAYPEVLNNIMDKTIHWKFLKSLEKPRVVHARCTDMITKDNLFAQVTVRFHTEQLLAIYDRFGRLMHGSEILAKDVLEYVVFEKHLSNEYGIWRLHDKIIPDWMPPKQPSIRSFRVREEPEQESKKEDEVVVVEPHDEKLIENLVPAT